MVHTIWNVYPALAVSPSEKGTHTRKGALKDHPGPYLPMTPPFLAVGHRQLTQISLIGVLLGEF